jgi:catechol 2,3-dioxygenase-like lactoylglutathione lyase family enzyme
MELNQVTLPALDIAASVAFYRRMGFEAIVDEPHYARFKSTVGDATFSIHVIDALTEPSKTVVYFECPDLDKQVADLRGRGLQFIHEPQDQPWLWREARLADPSGNILCLYQAGKNRLHPPWRVQALQPIGEAVDRNAQGLSAEFIRIADR